MIKRKKQTIMQFHENKLRLFSLFMVPLLFVASSNFVMAQVSAAISGRIEDASGAAVPDATVTVKNVETASSRSISSDEAGRYRALSLPVGQYEVKAEKPGFKTAVRSGINLVVGQEAVVNLQVDVGEIMQQVTVTGEAPVINTTTASVSGMVGEREVKDLPLNGRSFDNLITLNPGTVNYSAFKSGVTGPSSVGNYFSVAGRRPLDNLFLLNGIEYTSATNFGVTPGGVSGQLLGIDAVREFNTVTNTYSAQYGKRSGAQISIVTQSGTNQFHGAAFEFLRNSVLDARNFFDFPVGLRIPPFQRNQFGGSAGGPIRKDKAFLFGNYEGFRQRLGTSAADVVPDLNARQGLLPNASGVYAPVPNLNPAMLPYMVLWPLPNGRNLGDGTALAFYNPKQSIREDFGTLRLDYNASDKDFLSGAYTMDDGDIQTPLTNPLFVAAIDQRVQVVSLQETHIFSPQVLNTFRTGFSRAGYFFDTPPTFPVPQSLDFFPGRGPGGFIVGGGLTRGGTENTVDNHHKRNLFTCTDDVQISKGIHQISLGAWFQRLQANDDSANAKPGNATFVNLLSVLQGNMRNFAGVPNPTPMGWRTWMGAWYVEDSMQLRPRLTLRLGFRHEFTTGWSEVQGKATNFLFDANGALLTTPHIGSSALTENRAKRLFSPRIGMAWDPFGNAKTAIRAGIGIYYTLNDNLAWPLNSSPPFNAPISFDNVSLPAVLPISRGTPTAPPCGPTAPPLCITYNPAGIQSNMETPTVEQWNFTVEQQLTQSMALSLGYVGSFGYHNLIQMDPNAIAAQICSSPSGCTSGGINPPPYGHVPQGAQYIPVGTRPNPYLGTGQFFWSEGNSSYNALQAELKQRVSRGLQFRANYTWSKNLDTVSGLAGSQGGNGPSVVVDRNDLRRDWGPSNHNIEHQGGISASYELPIGRGKSWLGGVSGAGDKLASGWQVNAIMTFLSGLPITPLVGASRSGNGTTAGSTGADRPSVNPAFSGPLILGNINQWFDPKAYILPEVGTYGNAGRGVLTGPGLAEVDFSVFKSTALSERINMQFRAEFFNLLNRANFGTPSATVFSGNAYSSSAGLVKSTATTSRQIQFGLKLVF